MNRAKAPSRQFESTSENGDSRMSPYIEALTPPANGLLPKPVVPNGLLYPGCLALAIKLFHHGEEMND